MMCTSHAACRGRGGKTGDRHECTCYSVVGYCISFGARDFGDTRRKVWFMVVAWRYMGDHMVLGFIYILI